MLSESVADLEDSPDRRYRRLTRNPAASRPFQGIRNNTYLFTRPVERRFLVHREVFAYLLLNTCRYCFIAPVPPCILHRLTKNFTRILKCTGEQLQLFLLIRRLFTSVNIDRRRQRQTNE